MNRANELVKLLDRRRLDRITRIVERYTKFGHLLIDGAVGLAIVLAVLVIALVFYQAETITQVRNTSSLESDYHTLLAVRDTLAGSAELNWSKSVPIELWDGVLVGGDPRRVIWLKLPKSRLTGSIPAQLGLLDGLTHLNLGGNQLSGTIPAEIGDLSNLQLMWFSNNGLVGHVPMELDELKNLFNWRLGGNRLAGCVPKGLASVQDNDFDHLDLEICDDS